ncbi:MAG: FtsX-like permease family protein [Bacteroidaceae bacterium]|nr:FtsX-like permease family protein [Bacteroidaceae bacterium]
MSAIKSITKFLPIEGEVRRGSLGRGSLWLFLELVVITVVAWVVIDPAVVNLYYRCLPVGYDTDRLIYAEGKITCISYNANEAWDATEEYLPKLMNRLKSEDGMENVYNHTNIHSSITAKYYSNESLCYEQDTIYLAKVAFTSNRHFFETYGLKPLPGSPSAEELSKIDNKSNQVVLSESGAKALFGTAKGVVGKRIHKYYYRYDGNGGETRETCELTVAGVVADVQKLRYSAVHSCIYGPDDSGGIGAYIIIRLKKGINPAKYLEKHAQEIKQTAKTDFFRIEEIMPYEEFIHQEELEDRRPQEVNMSLSLAVFFLINLSLAVIGTVWLQAKRRTEECGVRRAFGATRPRLLLSFLAEGALLATVAVVIGCIIYLNYAHSGYETHGGYEEFNMYQGNYNACPLSDLTWVNHFWPHFLTVSAVVYIIILCTVLIGTAIPAIKIIRTNITDALREE